MFIQEQTAKECNVCFAMTRGDSVLGLKYLRIKKDKEVAAILLEPAIMQNCTSLRQYVGFGIRKHRPP